MRNIIFLFMAIFLLSNCMDQSPAPVEYNHGKSYNRNDDSKYPEKTIASVTQDEAIIEQQIQVKDEELSKPAGSLQDSNKIEEQVMPNKRANVKVIYYEVQANESLAQIAARYEQKEEEIAKLNNLEAPYKVEEFQTIKIEVSAELLNKMNKDLPEEVAIADPDNKVTPAANLYIKPVDGEITKNSKNKGINIIAKEGTEIRSIGSGNVVYAEKDEKFGNLIIVKLDNSDMYAAYAHMKDLILAKGASVKQSDIIGHVGTTGNVSSPQLHFTLRKGNKVVDPMDFLSK